MLSSLRGALLHVGLIAAATLLSAGWGWWMPREVSVDGIVVRESAAMAWAEAFAERWEDEPISLDAGESVLAVTPAEMGISRTIVVAEEFDVAVALHLAPARGTWRITVDEVAFEAFFEELTLLTERAPAMSPAGVVSGRALDTLLAHEAVLAAARTSQPLVRLPFRTIAYVEPPPQEEASATFRVEVATHTSSFRDGGDRWTRSRNIALAALAIDGVVIAPGATFSFSETLGPRTFARGFMPAEELARGEVVTGIGGGICQVATGLHEAALRGGLEIEEHHPHSQLPTYASPGIDTAVAWEQKDLRIRNTLPFHLRIRAVATDGTLSVQLLGSERGPEVSMETEIERAADGSMSVRRVRVVGAGALARRDEQTFHYDAPARRRL